MIAWAVLLLSLSVSVFAYASIRQLEQHELPLISDLTLGDRSLAIMSNETCVGTIASSFSREKGFHLHGNGLLRVTHAAQIISTGFEFDGRFNPLGQLVESSFEINAMGLTISLKSKNVNPIDITISAHMPPDTIIRNFSLPGPVDLIQDSPETYHLSYPIRSRGAVGLSGKLVEQLGQRLDLSLHTQPDNSGEHCSDLSGVVDISPLVAIASTQLELVDNWFSDSLMDGAHAAP